MKNLFLMLALIIFSLLAIPCAATDYAPLKRELKGIIDNGPVADVGLSLFVNGHEALSINDHRRYPMLSVFKLHQAVAVCANLQKNGIPLSAKVHIHKKDLHGNTHSPLRDKFPHGNINLSIEDLLRYTLHYSDNNVCDILFSEICGVAEVDKYIRSLGLADFAIGRNELEMHVDPAAVRDNWTYPSEASKLLAMLVSGKLDPCGKIIMNSLTDCATGKNRLVKYLSGEKIIIGHKTGTGDRSEDGKITGVNDIGFFLLPNGSWYVLSIFVTNASGSMEDAEELIARLLHAIYASLTSGPAKVPQ